MSGYKCVNYYDLCRLCTSSSGTKINIFSEDGKRKNVSQKITECLPLNIDEKDNLPKIICEMCLSQVESICDFRQICLNSQAMLEGCINTAALQNGGKIYIKEGGMTLKNISATAASNNLGNQTDSINQTTNSDFLSSIIQAVGIQNEDIQETKPIPQYTITMDGKSVTTNIEYKVQTSQTSYLTNQQQNIEQPAPVEDDKSTKNNSLAEFLKMKPNIRVTPLRKKQNTVESPKIQKMDVNPHDNQPIIVQPEFQLKKETVKTKKPKYNIVLTSPTNKQQTHQQQQQQQQQHQQTAPQIISQQILQTPHIQQIQLQPQNTATIVPTSIGTKALTMPDWKIVSAPSSKCYLPITIKDSSNNDQQIMAQIDTKNLILPATYQLQMKLQPQLSIDGQQIVQLTPSTIPATISLAPSQTVQTYQQQDQQIITGSIDVGTSTNDAEIIFNTNQYNQTQNINLQPTSNLNLQSSTLNLQSANLNIQQVQGLQNTNIVNIPQLQIKNISSNNPSAIQSQQISPQKLFNSNITVHRITNSNSANAQSQPKKSQNQNVQQQPQQQQQQQQQQSSQQKIIQRNNQKIVQYKQVKSNTVNNQITQQTQQVQFIQKDNISPVKIIKTTKLTPQQAKQVVAAQQMANKKLANSQNNTQATPKLKTNVVTTQKLPVRRTLNSSAPVQQQQQQIITQQQHQIQPQTQQQQSKQPKQITIRKTTSIKVANPTLAFTTPSAAAASAKVNPVTNLLECSICSRGFKKKEHLAQHMKLHAGVRPFKCNEAGCAKAFSRKEHLMRHIVSHTGKKLFSCDMCQKYFSRKDNLNKHKRTHSDQSTNSSGGQYVCDVCKKVFVVKMYYLQHKLLHEKNEQQKIFTKLKNEEKEEKTTNVSTTNENTNIIKIESVNTTNNQIHEVNNQHQQQTIQQKNQPQLVQIQLPVVTSNNFNRGTITISQADGTVLKTLNNHDSTVLNLPTSLANYMQLNSAQFITTTGDIVGHIKIEK